MNNTLLIALLSGGFAATATVLSNMLIKISDRKLNNKIAKINALSAVEYLICNLGIVRPLDQINYNYYFSIFDNINSIESYINSVRLINTNRFYLSHSIIGKIEMLENLFQHVITTYYQNVGNEDMTILDIGADNFEDILKIKKDLRVFIDEELKKLK